MVDHIPAVLNDHPLAADSLAFSLADEIETLEASTEAGGRNAITLLKENGTSVVLIAMDKGNRIAEHKAPGVVTIHVLKGHIEITGDDRTIAGRPGTLLAFRPAIVHSLHASEASAVLLTVSPPA